MKNPFIFAAAALMVIVPPFAMFVIEKVEQREAVMAIPPAEVPGIVVMYTSPG